MHLSDAKKWKMTRLKVGNKDRRMFEQRYRVKAKTLRKRVYLSVGAFMPLSTNVRIGELSSVTRGDFCSL